VALDGTFGLTAAVAGGADPLWWVDCTFDSDLATVATAGWTVEGLLGQPVAHKQAAQTGPRTVRINLQPNAWTPPATRISYNAGAGLMRDVLDRPLETFIDRPIPFP